MNDPSGVPPALGIETVHWFAQGGENLTVRVTGRWRRRRPSWSGQPLLVIEAQGRRHRFPAMPEPPSLTGTAPGTWQMSFSVPASLAPHLSGRAWLQLGAVMVQLPSEVQPEDAQAEPAAAASGPDPETLAQRRAFSSELAVQAARQRAAAAEAQADELAARVRQLERELELARREPERLQALLAERERATRAVEQREYAERARREELQEQLGERFRPASDPEEQLAELAAVEERVRELEAEIEQLRRQTDEAEQVAAAAHAARERAERERAERRATELSGMRAEIDLARTTPAADAALTPRVASAAVEAHELLGLRSEREMVHLQGWLATLLARESARRAQDQARATTLERELHEALARNAQAYDAIEELRGELDAGRLALAEQLGAGLTPVQSVDPERLSAALTRLREASPEPQPAAEGLHSGEPAVGPASDWLARVFRALTDRDAAAAGRLALALLPAQRLVAPDRLAYDLVLEELGCVRVDITDTVRVQTADGPRPRAFVRFQVFGDLPGLARLLASGRLGRRIRHGRARVKGDRRALRALTGLVRAPVSLRQIQAEGVRMPPSLAFTVLSLMIDPDWTKAERFTIAHQDDGAQAAGIYLNVRDGAPLSVTDSAPSAPVTTIVCAADVLLAVVYGDQSVEAELRGDARPLALLQSWVKRAQSG